MGCGQSKPASAPVDGVDPKEADKAITKELAIAKKEMSKEVKLLMLGPGDSGKSTVVKQLKIIFLSGYNSSECRAFRSTVYTNVLDGMRQLAVGVQRLELEVSDDNKSRLEFFAHLSSDEQFSESLVADVKALWADPVVQQAHQRRSEFQMDDWAHYFFNEIDRISDPAFIPTEDDIVRARVRTTGITEMKFQFGGMGFRVMDVGGQRTERRKWIHCFDTVTAVIFCVSLSEYDQRLFEDERKWRIQESLDLFRETWDNEHLQNVSMILFLNKSDLFETKIKSVDPKISLPDYTGGLDYTKALNYIRDLYMDVGRGSPRRIYPHLTNAADTGSVKFVFEAVQNIILRGNLTIAV